MRLADRQWDYEKRIDLDPAYESAPNLKCYKKFTDFSLITLSSSLGYWARSINARALFFNKRSALFKHI